MNIRRFVIFAACSFVFLAFMFSLCRRPIATFNSWCLALTGEITVKQKQNKADEYTFIQDRVRLKKLRSKKPPKSGKSKKTRKVINKFANIDFDNPELADLPKTPSIKIPLLDSEPSPGDVRLAVLPKLRIYTGIDFKKETTNIKAGIYGNKLYLYFICSDKEPEQLVKKSTRDRKIIHQDDSVEIFLMKDAEAENYLHLLCNFEGTSDVRNFTALETNPLTKKKGEWPDGVKPPFAHASKTRMGYTMILTIDMSIIGFKQFKPGNKFLLQIVRNYRGGKMTLQLFPHHVYGDKNMGPSNHDRRAFEEVLIIGK